MNRVNKTRFMEVDECKKNLTEISLSDSELEAGGIPFVVEGDKAYIDTGENHTIVFGATGSRKTRGLVMPTIELLSRAGESFVVTDPKGELYRRTADYAQRNDYQVLVLNLRELAAGMAWNPLILPYECYQEGQKSKALELLSETMGMLVMSKHEKDKFWMNSSKDVLVGLGLVLFELAEQDECHIKSLIKLWDEYKQDKKSLKSIIENHCKDTTIMRKLSCLYNVSSATVGSIEAFVDMGLNKLVLNEKLVAKLSMNEIKLSQITGKKTAIYLIIPDENTHYHFIVSLFLEQLYEVLIKKSYLSAGNRLQNRMNFMIDEFANLPKIENMDSMITAARSRNIRFYFIVQSLNQLKQKYDKTAEVICGNCNNWIYLYSKEYELLNEISRLCGEVIYDNNMKMPLISEFDLQHLDKESGEALVLMERNNPCIVNFQDIERYPFEHQEAVLLKDEKDNVSIPVFKWKENNEDSFIKRLPMRKYAQKYQEPIQPSHPYWLVGSFHGMIIVEEIVNEMELRGDFAKSLLCKKWLNGFQEMDMLKWDVLSCEMQSWYNSMMIKYPERIFLTLDEVMNQRVEAGCPLLQQSFLGKRYAMELIFCQGERIAKQELGDIPYYPNVLGDIYANQMLFHMANAALKDTEMFRCHWKEYYNDRFTQDMNILTDYAFWKKATSEDYVVARLIRKG